MALLDQPADPWAAIRQLQFQNNQMTVTGDPETGGYTSTIDNWDLAGETGWDDLKNAGFESKYNRIEQRPDGTFVVRMQQPGAHKYDTMDVVYKVDPATGVAQMVGDPVATRETSSKDKWQDRLEKSAILAGAVGGAGYLGTLAAGAGAGGAATGAAAGTSGVNLGAIGTAAAKSAA